MFSWLFSSQHSPPPSPELKRHICSYDPIEDFPMQNRFDLYIEALNYRGQIRGKTYCNANGSLKDYRDAPVVYHCASGLNRPCFLAEALKRGADPNQPYCEEGYWKQIIYPVHKTMYHVKRFTIRMLLLHGANFNLKSTVLLHGQIALQSPKELVIEPAMYHDEKNSRCYRFYGPVENWSNPLPSQQPSFLFGKKMVDYLSQVEQEVAQLQQLKTQADNAFKANNVQLAAQYYDDCGNFAARFAGDHEELALFYLDMALNYVNNATACYKLIVDSPLANAEQKQSFVRYLQQQIDRIEITLRPNPAIQPLRREDVPVDNPIGVLSNPEEVKTMEGSAVRRSIINHYKKFIEQRDFYQQNIQEPNPISLPENNMGLRHRPGHMPPTPPSPLANGTFNLSKETDPLLNDS